MKKILFIFFVSIGIFSCDLGEEPAIEGTQLQEMCGEWYIQVLLEDGTDVGGGYHLISTSNTAANTTTDLLLDDHELWPCKIKCKVDLASKSFVAQNGISNYYSDDAVVSIFEGKIWDDAATTSGGNKSDSIYVKFEFGDDPGTKYIYAGYKRTGFLEDEH